MDHAHPQVTVAIPNWNGAHLLRSCLESLREQAFGAFDVVVIDNGSTDASLDMLSREFQQVRVVSWPANRGFAAAVNEGIRQARGETVALLNNDMELDTHWLEELYSALCDEPSAGACACKILFRDRRTINSAGDYYRTDGTPGNRGVHELDRGQYDRREFVFGPSAGAALYRRAMFDHIGLFDERFVSYCEDVDLNFRMQLAGYRCLYVPEAIAYHWGSATGGGVLASYQCGRNFINVILKDIPGPTLRRHWRSIVLRELRLAAEALRHSREPAARARLCGQIAGLCDARWSLRERREMMRQKKVGDEYIESLLI